MNASKIIVQALSQFRYPCNINCYDGSEKKYFTFNYADERGADYGDNEPGCIKVSMQIHFFLPMDQDHIQEKKQIREALFAAGFTYPVVTELIETENNVRHIVYECDITEEREE